MQEAIKIFKQDLQFFKPMPATKEMRSNHPLLVKNDSGESKIINAVLITIDNTFDEYDVCVNHEKYAAEHKPKGDYNDGFGTPGNATIYGMLGEMALGKLLINWDNNIRLDFSHHVKGDGGKDIIYFNNKIDIKTKQLQDYLVFTKENGINEVKFKNNSSRVYSGKCLIKYKDDDGPVIPLHSDFYVCAYVQKDDRKNCIAEVVLVGWQTKNFFESDPSVWDDEWKVPITKRGAKNKSGLPSTFSNRELYFYKLKPIKELLINIKRNDI